MMILAYSVGMTLNYFGMQLIESGSYYYGISFWIFLTSLVVMGVAVVYQNRKMSQISKEELIIKLI